MRDFRHLDVWHKAHAFVLDVYGVTENFPKVETFGLAATLRRGSSRIAMKIAEGAGQNTREDLVQCMQAARATAMEVEYQLLLARDLHFIEPSAYEALQHQVIEVRKMLSGLIRPQHV